ncbi:GIY-YIG nuclease family protein [Algoriphagus faecimaris]|uniref:GIY-YIG nuclease family protein n=1 Tax=Algoriphagus faecimaris TaxID=686796 RepID=UPI0030B830D0
MASSSLGFHSSCFIAGRGKYGNGLYYVGSTSNLKKRIEQHQLGEGANFTRKNLPVRLVYFKLLTEMMMPSIEKNKFKNGQGLKKKL